MKFDDIFLELGEFGPYQKRIYYLSCLVAIPAAFHMLIGVFTLAVPDHRCVVPGLERDTYESQGQWHDLQVMRSIPWSNETGTFSKCRQYSQLNGSEFNTNATTACTSWVYKKDPFQSTFITETDLVCDKISLRTYSNMMLMVGLLCGSFLMGTLADIFGRKKIMILGIVGNLACSLATAFVTSYIAFVALKALTVFFGAGMFLPVFVLSMEIVGPSKRTLTGIVIEMYWVVGMFILTGAAYGLRDWRHLQIALSAPTALLLVFFFVIPESPRWLANKGRHQEASIIIQKMAAVNGVTLSDKVLSLRDLDTEGKGEKIWQMLTNLGLLVRCLIIFFNWMVASMVYYGLSLNVGSLYGDIYLNFFLSGLVELASYVFCILLLDVWGRKPLQCASMLIGGVACLCTLFPVIYQGPGWVTVTLSLVGKFGASAAFAVIYIFSAELFPTVMRNSAMGLCSLTARIGGILAPYISDIGNQVEGDLAIALPLIIFGCVSIAAGGLALLLPETVGKTLPDTVEDAKQFGRKNSGKNSYTLHGFDSTSTDDTQGTNNPAFVSSDNH